MQDIRQKLISIKEKVENRVFDPYLLQFIETPIVDEDKLLILVSIMDRMDLSYHEMENYALSTMLVQIALDTHEHITSTNEEKNRQLTVLAGDYFSGLYYKLLADSDDIFMIKALSEGIKQVNEHKTSVYFTESEDIEQLMKSMMVIESSLLSKLAEYFNIDLWNDVLAYYLLFKRLLNEKALFLQTGSSILFAALKKIMVPLHDHNKDLPDIQNDQLLKVCDRYLELSKQIIEKGIPKLPYLNHLLEGRISNLLNQYQPYAKTFVEEG